MQIKKYLEQDMRRAMRKVSDDLGPDAVILSTSRQGDQVEVVAALDYDDNLLADLKDGKGNTSDAGDARSSRRTPAPGSVPTASVSAPVAGDSQIQTLQEELSRLRGLFEDELSDLAWGERARRQPGRPALQKRLQQLGLGRELMNELLEGGICSEDLESSWRKACESLAQRLPVMDRDLLDVGGRIAMVGPTGVGKTTTIAKLAARFALRHGRNQVGLISTDRFRVGAQEQLFTFGSLLGVPVQAATSAADLSRSLASFADRALVLIDTAGMGQRDLGLTDQFTTLSGAGADIETYLVLSAIAQQQVLNEAVQAFSRMGLAGAIITKIDEAASLGPVMTTLAKSGLPMAFIGNGQRVPEDMLPARGVTLVEEAIRLASVAGGRSRQQAGAAVERSTQHA